MALETEHARFRVGGRLARRYPADVVPFAAVAGYSNESLAELEKLLIPDEHVYLFGAQPPATNGLNVETPLDTHQMVWPTNKTIDASGEKMQILRMTAGDASDMVELTTLAFPGFFRKRTHKMGSYYGIRVDGELVAMAGERLLLPGMREISAVVTRPGHTGKGYGRTLMNTLLREHENAGVMSFLHVGVRNTRAVSLYERMGFEFAGSITLWPVTRAANA
jgi:ribosomal protein S18 acetylase RimI-like enzyme